MGDSIMLFDLPSKGRRACWSPNVWKVRLVLNYKGLPYETVWLEHHEIQDRIEATGVSPNPTGQGSPYTLPTIRLPNGNHVMESTAIAQKLEQLYPTPSLHLQNGVAQKVGPILGKIYPPLIPVFMPRIGRDVICPASYDYFQEKRAKRFGMSLDELEKAKGGEQAWEAARPGIEELDKFLEDHKKGGGPFLGGSEPSYADFLIASAVESLKRIGLNLYEPFVVGHSNIKELHEACGKWFEKDE